LISFVFREGTRRPICVLRKRFLGVHKKNLVDCSCQNLKGAVLW